MEFRCIQDCSQCCIEREYFPNKKFGKIGVLILPEEKEKIEKLAEEKGVDVIILPRIGISTEKNLNFIKILAYQMMGREKNGNTCPFLDTGSGKKSPHGGFPCSIYEKRPLACKAYPLIDSSPTTLDQKCKFCKEYGNANENLNSEIESLVKIQTQMKTGEPFVWRYATGIGEESDKNEIKRGWVLEE
jgi:Fe-S-cluster containining protein